MRVFERINSYYGPELQPYDAEFASSVQKELHDIVCKLIPIRDNKEKTEEYFNNVIRKYSSCLEIVELIQALLIVLKEDKLSFSYIYYYMSDWAQGAFNNVPMYKYPTQKEIEYAINFDLEDIEKIVKKSEKPIETITAILDKSKSNITLDCPYKNEVEKYLKSLLKTYNNEVSKTDFLTRHDKEEEDMKTLHRLFDGKKGKVLAIAVQVAVDKHIIAKSPSFEKLKAHFNVIGSHSAYEQYQGEFSDIKMMKPKDRETYLSIWDSLEG